MWIKDWHGLYRDDNWGEHTQSESELQLEITLFKRVIYKADTIIELGAGYGSWCLAAVGLKPSIKCIAVEADSIHYAWLCEAFRYNRIDGVTINRAIHNAHKRVLFVTGKEDVWYGQTVIDRPRNYYRQAPPWKYRLVKTINLADIVSMAHGSIYINSDIQGSERYAFDKVPKQVTYMHIATHSVETHEYLKKQLSPEFNVTVEYPLGYKDHDIQLCDGILELERR